MVEDYMREEIANAREAMKESTTQAGASYCAGRIDALRDVFNYLGIPL